MNKNYECPSNDSDETKTAETPSLVPSRIEARDLSNYLNKIADHVPRGLSRMQDALTFTILDLISYARHGIEMKSLLKAYAFAKSIPVFTDFESEEFCAWLINDVEHLKYM